MEIRFLTPHGVTGHAVDDLDTLLRRDDGFCWIDIADCDAAAVAVLSDTFDLHPLAVAECARRNQMPKVHAYRDHVFVVLHAPEPGAAGHVHYVELDQFVGSRYLITVHGPVNPAVDTSAVLRDTSAVLARIEAGRLRPAGPFALSHAIVSSLARHQEAFVERHTAEVWKLEQRVTAGHLGDPETFLEQLFRTRHALVTVRTMAVLSRETYGRLSRVAQSLPADAEPLLDDIIDQFNRVQAIADGEKEYLQGVIDFYRTRSDTKMTVAAERLAVIAAVTLPITALSSVYGMNLIVNDRTQLAQLVVVLVIMALMSGTLLRWARRQGWW